jgi:hypothetical protein
VPEAEKIGNGDGKAKLLQTLASSPDRMVQLGTLGMVAVSGIASLFQGEKISTEGHRDRDKAIQEIHSLYDRIDEFERRQKQQLENTNQLLEHDTEILREVHKITLNLDEWHRNEQMRGAPP